MIEIIQHFLLTFMHLADAFIQSDLQCIQAIHFFVSNVHVLRYFKIHIYVYTYINKYFWYTGLHSFNSGDFFVHTHARTHYSDAHTTCEKVSLRLLPKSHQKPSQSTLVLLTPPSPCFCSFCLLFYAIQNSSSLPSRSPGNHSSFVDGAQEIAVISHL